MWWYYVFNEIKIRIKIIIILNIQLSLLLIWLFGNFAITLGINNIFLFLSDDVMGYIL